MKAILVTDMPDNCMECDVKFRDWQTHCCAGDDEKREVWEYAINGTKPDWCPLREMPEREHDADLWDDYYRGVEDGWNNCIDEILGE